MSHTHYDNLRVTRNASPAIIKAAYRVMSAEYHPDKNPGRDTTRIMQILNDAYAVLSDPIARNDYDTKLAFDEVAEVNNREAEQAAERRRQAAEAMRKAHAERQAADAAQKAQAEQEEWEAEQQRQAADAAQKEVAERVKKPPILDRLLLSGPISPMAFVVVAEGLLLCLYYFFS